MPAGKKVWLFPKPAIIAAMKALPRTSCLDGKGQPIPAAIFPRGLRQPPGSFRFSLDALLLAAAVPPGRHAALLDCGTGCGAAALGALLRSPGLRGVGLDLQPELIQAARLNAERLGLGQRFAAETVDFRNEPDPALKALLQASFDCCIMNPPYRILGRGRLPSSELRARALFGEPGLVGSFLRWAGMGLHNEGILYLIFPAGDEGRLALEENGFFPFRKTLVSSRPGMPPHLLLLESAKKKPSARPEQKKLFLFAGKEKHAPYSDEAVAFCPWLEQAQAANTA